MPSQKGLFLLLTRLEYALTELGRQLLPCWRAACLGGEGQTTGGANGAGSLQNQAMGRLPAWNSWAAIDPG